MPSRVKLPWATFVTTWVTATRTRTETPILISESSRKEYHRGPASQAAWAVSSDSVALSCLSSQPFIEAITVSTNLVAAAREPKVP